MIGIGADSTCDLPQELLDKYAIATLPLSIIVDGKNYQDGIDIDADKLFSLVEEQGTATTAAVSVGAYVDYFAQRRAQYDAVIHFTISAELSSCYQNACIAAAEFDNVYVIDSRSLSLGIGMLVTDAAKMAAEGMAAQEIVAQLEAKKEKLDVSFVLSTLEYMRRGGRCSSVTAIGANLLQFRPCISMREGKLGVSKKYRGAFENVLAKYAEDRLADAETVDTQRLFIVHSGVEESVLEQFRAAVSERVSFAQVDIVRAGCTISNHCGPGCASLMFYRK